MAARRDLAISVEGLRDLRRALKHTETGLDRNVRSSLKEMADGVRDKTRSNAPRVSGRLQASIRSSVTTNKASVYSNLVYAPVVEFGRIRGGPFKGRFFMRDAVRESQPRVTRQLEALLDDIADDYERF